MKMTEQDRHKRRLKPLPGDRKLRETAQTAQREVPLQDGWLRISADGCSFECRSCGRFWRTDGEGTSKPLGRKWDHSGFASGHRRAAGFVKSAATNHASVCRQATPEERRAIARLDEARWQKQPPTQHVENDHSHRGYGNEPVWPSENADQ